MMVLNSANPEQANTLYYINPAFVVSFYRGLKNDKTLVFTSDGKNYDVKETPQKIKSWLDNWDSTD